VYSQWAGGLENSDESVATRKSNSVRIIAGTWRSRLVHFPAASGLRPTPDRVRETLFNWLGQDLTGKRCLDLFAGSGALGFEALSRGAEDVVFVERSASIRRAIAANADRLGARGVRLIAGDALEFAATTSERFDTVFVDPPYGSGLAEAVLPRLPRLLAADSLVYVESDRVFSAPQPWQRVRSGRAGAVHYCLIRRGDNDATEPDSGGER
jgi:16S rRNA (guanine966-N2)-methyltransferase